MTVAPVPGNGPSLFQARRTGLFVIKLQLNCHDKGRRDAVRRGNRPHVLDIGREAETFGGIVVGKLKLVAVPIDDEETAFRYTKPWLPRWWKSSMGRSHDGSVQPFVPAFDQDRCPIVFDGAQPCPGLRRWRLRL